MDGLFPDSIPLALRVVAWIVGGWLVLRLWLFYRVYRRRIACSIGLVRLLPPPNHGKWTKKHDGDLLARSRLHVAGHKRSR